MKMTREGFIALFALVTATFIMPACHLIVLQNSQIKALKSDIRDLKERCP
jgi:hypothetical protein